MGLARLVVDTFHTIHNKNTITAAASGHFFQPTAREVQTASSWRSTEWCAEMVLPWARHSSQIRWRIPLYDSVLLLQCWKAHRL